MLQRTSQRHSQLLVNWEVPYLLYPQTVAGVSSVWIIRHAGVLIQCWLEISTVSSNLAYMPRCLLQWFPSKRWAGQLGHRQSFTSNKQLYLRQMSTAMRKLQCKSRAPREGDGSYDARIRTMIIAQENPGRRLSTSAADTVNSRESTSQRPNGVTWSNEYGICFPMRSAPFQGWNQLILPLKGKEFVLKTLHLRN